jgi:hypothetical protein
LPDWLVLAVILLAVFIQTVTGFGAGLLAMAFLPALLGVRTAAPLVVLVACTLELFLIIRLRAHFNFNAVWRLMLAALLGIPLGVWLLRVLSERLLLLVLGAVIACYALYGLFNLRLPKLEGAGWAYLAGFLSGLLGGAYSVSGPPAIIYGTCQEWAPDEFKSNLQGFFLVGDGLTILNHAIVGNLTPLVWTNYWWSLPVIALGLAAGAALDRVLNPQLFRTLVLVLLVLMGVELMLSSLLA